MDSLAFFGNKIDDREIEDLFQKVKIEDEPVGSHTDNLDCLAFPELYPYGKGGCTVERTHRLNKASFEKTKLQSADNDVRRNLQYIFHLAQQKELRDVKRGVFQATHNRLGRITKKQLEEGAKGNSADLMKHVTAMMGELPSRPEYWRRVQQRLEAMILLYGPPTFFLTLSPGNYIKTVSPSTIFCIKIGNQSSN